MVWVLAASDNRRSSNASGTIFSEYFRMVLRVRIFFISGLFFCEVTKCFPERETFSEFFTESFPK